MLCSQEDLPTIVPNSICIYKKGCICNNYDTNLTNFKVNISFGDICKFKDFIFGTMVTYEHTADYFICHDSSECICGQLDEFQEGFNYCLRNANGTYEYVDANSQKLIGKQIIDEKFLNEKIQSLKNSNKYGDNGNRNTGDRYCIFPDKVVIEDGKDEVQAHVERPDNFTVFSWKQYGFSMQCIYKTEIKKLII